MASQPHPITIQNRNLIIEQANRRHVPAVISSGIMRSMAA
jgi:hypothetical protein